MKRPKAILLLIALALVLTLAAASAGVWMYRDTPNWYAIPRTTPDERRDVANAADQKLLDIYSWAAAVQARLVRQHRAAPATMAADDPPIGPKVVSISAAELNALVDAWQAVGKTHRRSTLSQYISDGRLILQDDQIILAGQSAEFGTVVSAAFEPSIDSQGRLHLDLAAINAGRLPVPQVLIANRMGLLKTALRQRLASYQQNAHIDNKFTANEPASASIATRLLLDSLNGRASEALICVPFDLTDTRRQLPVRVSSVKVDGETLTLQLEPLSDNDRPLILKQITAPYDEPSLSDR